MKAANEFASLSQKREGVEPYSNAPDLGERRAAYAGLYYPISVAAMTVVVGSLLLRETSHVLVWDELKDD